MDTGTASLIDQSPWWLVPYVVFMLFMVHAMMEFTVNFLMKRPPANRKPVDSDELRRRLLALNEADQPHPIVEGQDCDLEIKWATVDARRGRLALSRHSSSFHLRFLLDEQRHELRLHQTSSGSGFFLGLEGRLPRIRGYASFSAGPPGEALTKEINRVTSRSGWAVRPVLWWFQATHPGTRFLQALTPALLRRWPARRFWGILYPLSYFMGMGYLIAVIGPLDQRNLLILVGVSAVWWGFWGFFMWALCGFPAFWRRRSR